MYAGLFSGLPAPNKPYAIGDNSQVKSKKSHSLIRILKFSPAKLLAHDRTIQQSALIFY
jgi:hypothetical protein